MKTVLLSLLLTALSTGVAHPFCFDEAGAIYNIHPDILRSIAVVESGMDPNAVNRSNKNGSVDVGLMQVNSWWQSRVNKKLWASLTDPCTNVKIGAWILADCFARQGYRWESVGCYNSTSEEKRQRYTKKVYKVYANENY